MKILQVCPRYYPIVGGVEEHVRKISEQIARTHDITVFTTDPFGKLPPKEIIGNVEIKRFKSYAPNEAYYISEGLRKSLLRYSEKFDLVHAHNYHAFPAFYASQAKNRNRFIFTAHYHGTDNTPLRALLHKPYKLFGEKIFRNADKIVCVSNYEKNLLSENFNFCTEKIVVIPNGVEASEFNGLKKQDNGHKTILCVARLEKYKGIDYLIKTLPKLNNEVILEIVGEGPYRETLVKLVQKYRVGSRVKFCRNISRSELLQKYVNAALFVLLSKHEAYGITVAESLTAGVPCLVANSSGLTEWIDNINCFGVDLPINIDELATRLTDCMEKRICKPILPSWREVANQVMKIYESLV